MMTSRRWQRAFAVPGGQAHFVSKEGPMEQPTTNDLDHELEHHGLPGGNVGPLLPAAAEVIMAW